LSYAQLKTHTRTEVLVNFVTKLQWQTNNLPTVRLGQNGNHAVNSEGNQLWDIKLSNDEREEIKKHIAELTELLPEKPNEEWSPTQDIGGQMTLIY
jgi:hypothetical protein